MPYNMLMSVVGSNGMAAGNTPAEALFQGLSELLERWGAAEIFFKQLTPPTVPDEFLKHFPEEYAIIRSIEKSGKYKIEIKDFSAALKIPVLGLILRDAEKKVYRLNVGSDTSFQVALSRCLTEVYQGIGNEEALGARMNPLPETESEYFLGDSPAHLYSRFLEFGKFTMDNSGVYPLALFGESPDYDFDPAVFTTREDYAKEVSNILTNLHNKGYNVYVRDVSFLGFSSVLVYVPEVSALGRKWLQKSSGMNEFSLEQLDRIQDTFFNFRNSGNEQELRELAEAFSKISSHYNLGDIFYIDTKTNSKWGQIKISFFLTQLWYRVGEFAKARDTFKAFLKQRKEIPEYYRIIEQYLELKPGNPVEEIHKKLRKMDFTAETVEKVCRDLHDPAKIFQYIKFPQCPHCSSCALSDECITRQKMAVSHNLYTKMKERKIEQASYSDLLAV